MNKLKDILNRVERLTKPHTVTIDNFANGVNKPISYTLQEAKRLCLLEIEAKL